MKIDILHKKPVEEEKDIYEVKVGTVRPLDVYQLVMYWDGFVKDGNTPSLGRIVAKRIPSGVEKIISSLNTMKDANGNVYYFEGKTIEELGIEMD